MISAAKIDQALAKIDHQRKQSYVDNVQKVVAEIEQGLEQNPFSILEQFEKLDQIYAAADKDKQDIYAEIKTMLSTAIREYATILVGCTKEIIRDTPES
jgi:Txe/YoeB family toxin of Txe-Axe toxin-antitoxin module